MVENIIKPDRNHLRYFIGKSGWTGSLVKDPVFLTLVAITVLLTALDYSQVGQSFEFLLQSMWEMLPFFALAIGLAVYAKATSADRRP